MVQSIRADWTDHDAIYGKGPDTRSKCLAYYEDLVDLNTAVKKMLNR